MIDLNHLKQATISAAAKRRILSNVPMPYSVWFKAKEVLIWKSIIEWL